MDVREKLVEIFCSVLGVEPNFSDAEAMEFVEGLIANGVTVHEWISVKDRLPDVGRDVLFVRENKSYGVGAYSDTYLDFFSGQFPVKGVTHWMPLPEPPKEVQK